MRQNPHVRICGGPGSATTLVYPTTTRPQSCRAVAREDVICIPMEAFGIVKLSGIALIDPQHTWFATGLEPIILGVGQPDSA